MTASETSLYERVLSDLAAGRAALPPPRPPRPSAAVVPWRRTAGGDLEVFWIRRSAGLAFMGGWYAFPGGALARGDAEVPLAGEPAGSAGAAAAMPETISEGLGDLGPDVTPGIAACALRELFEETGLLPLAAAPPPAVRLAAARRRLLAGEARFADLTAELGGPPDASRLVFAGRWLTPPLGPQRFDNRFFLLAWPPSAGAEPEVIPGEVEAGEWVVPAAALARWRAGEVLAAPPILHLLTVLAEVGPEAGLARLRDPAETVLGPFRRVEFRPGVLLFPLPAPTLPPATHTNAFLVGHGGRGGGEAALVDPGSPDPRDSDRLLAALKAAEEGLGRRPTAIWLTHHHPDHVGGVARLREALGVPVRAHPATAERLAARGLGVDRPFAPDERLILAGEPPMPVRVVHTPGHARGHLCFLDEDGGSLLAGDLLSALSTIVIDPPEGDMGDYLDSLERVRRLAPRTLFPAHGPALRDGAARLAALIAHRREREARVLAAWRAGRRDPEAMLPSVYDEIPPGAAPLAARQVAAHLDHLRRQGLLAEAER